jgi:hypothetical protein
MDMGAPGASDVDDKDRALAPADSLVDEIDIDLPSIGEWSPELSEIST